MSVSSSDITAVMEFLPKARAKLLPPPDQNPQDIEFEKLSPLQQNCVISIHKSYGYLDAQKINYLQVIRSLLKNGHTLVILCPYSRTEGEVYHFELNIPEVGRIGFETDSHTAYPQVLKKYFVLDESQNGFRITVKMNDKGVNIIKEVADTLR